MKLAVWKKRSPPIVRPSNWRRLMPTHITTLRWPMNVSNSHEARYHTGRLTPSSIGIGPWSVHARNQIARILEGDKLKMVYKRQK